MSLEFQAILQLGCVCIVDPRAARKIMDRADIFTLKQLEFKSIAFQSYLKQTGTINYIFLYHHLSSNRQRALWGLFLSASKRGHRFVLDSDYEESSSCAANNSGTYSSVCVQLDVESLVDMAVGGDAATVIPSYDEITLCNPAFKTLRSMVNAWLLEKVSVYKNVFADYQLIHFYQWLRSPSILLYDLALRRILHTYMKKLYI